MCMFAVTFQLSLYLKTSYNEIERICDELCDRGASCARGRMAEGRKRRPNCAVVMTLIRDMVQRECILEVLVWLSRGIFD